MTSATLLERSSPVEDFRAHLLVDVDLQDQLASIEDRGEFLAAACAIAATLGIALDSAQLDEALRPHPLGGCRTGMTTRHGWPPRHWLPAALVQAAGEPAIEWTHFGTARLTEPFFDDSWQRARRRPLNRLIRHRTPLATLACHASGDRVGVPDGLIFHMSRCGSTLVAQMLAALPTSIVVSEAPVLDAVLRTAQTQPAIPEAERIAMLRAIVAALGRDRHGARSPFVIKLDSWHSLALPLFRRAFPDTPWVFLYRDPLEVMLSQQRIRGLHTIAGAVDALDDMADGAPRPAELHTAHILARICEAALTHRSLGRGLFVDYALLPDAVERLILPHFGIAPDGPHCAAMRRAAARDAKTPALAFARDPARRHTADDAVRRATETVLAAVHRRLDAAGREAHG